MIVGRVDRGKEGLAAAGVAADNLAMALYFLVLFALPSVPWLRGRFVRRVVEVADSPDNNAADHGPPVTVRGMATALAVSAAVCALGTPGVDDAFSPLISADNSWTVDFISRDWALISSEADADSSALAATC